MSDDTISYEYCDTNALPAERTAASSLEQGPFHKLCPGSLRRPDGAYAPLGQPRCGDGSNYSFMFAGPGKQPEQPGGEKIYIELIGGGACWDALTCGLQSFFLSIPDFYDTLVGTRCDDSEVGEYILCSKTIGGTDFSEYNTIVIPYCTQDVHLGDEPQTSYGVQAVGAHNIYRTLQWMFDNFPDPANIFITGCSAGGTALPIVYDLINQHYGSGHAVQIDAVVDSSVFLTPSYFLENHFPEWNVGTIMERIEFDFDEYKNQESMPVEVMSHVMQRSKETDNYGFAQYDADAVSIYYYKMMSGEPIFGRQLSSAENHRDVTGGPNFRRRTTVDYESQWWSEMDSSLQGIDDVYPNFDTFVREGTGHCFGGLVSYYLKVVFRL